MCFKRLTLHRLNLTSIRSRFIHQILKSYSNSSHIPYEKRIHQNCLRLSSLPLLSSIVKSVENVKLFENFTILNIQHQLGDVTGQTEALISLGASPLNTYFLPPSYTQHKRFESFVMENFKIPRENLFQTSYCLRYNYEKYRLIQVIYQLKRMIEMELIKSRNKQYKNLLVLDDGGCFSEALTTLSDIENQKFDLNQLMKNVPSSLAIDKSHVKVIMSYLRSIRVCIVEQTSRGLFKYIDQVNIGRTLNQLGISIIDVASSEPKKRLEPPLIAEACLNMLSYLFYDAPKHLQISKPSKLQKCLLLGYGAIGQAIGYALTHKGDLGMFSKDSVKIWDRDTDKCELAQKDGFEIFDQWTKAEQFDYVIGCAGRCSLPISSLSLLRNKSYLISVSSAAIEFPVSDMIECALNHKNIENIKIQLSNEQVRQLHDEDIHRNIEFEIESQRFVTVVNGGMPITFVGILNPAVPEKFDLTVSCMIAACIQAVRTKQQITDNNRIIPLDANYSKMICNWFDQNRTAAFE